MRGWRNSCVGRATAASIASLACFSSAWRKGVIVSGCENSGSASPLLPTATARTKNPRPLKSEVIVGGGARGTTAVGSVTRESIVNGFWWDSATYLVMSLICNLLAR